MYWYWSCLLLYCLRFLLEFNLYSWWNIDLSVKGWYNICNLTPWFWQTEREKSTTLNATLLACPSVMHYVFLSLCLSWSSNCLQLIEARGAAPWWFHVTQSTLPLFLSAPSKRRLGTLTVRGAWGTAAWNKHQYTVYIVTHRVLFIQDVVLSSSSWHAVVCRHLKTAPKEHKNTKNTSLRAPCPLILLSPAAL